MYRTLAKAAAGVSFGLVALLSLPATASARDWDDHYHVEQRCTGHGDRCALFRCDRDGDRCTRVSAWQVRRSDWDDRYRYQSYRRDRDDRHGGFITQRCDRDGDRCVTLRCDHDGDHCVQVH